MPHFHLNFLKIGNAEGKITKLKRMRVSVIIKKRKFAFQSSQITACGSVHACANAKQCLVNIKNKKQYTSQFNYVFNAGTHIAYAFSINIFLYKSVTIYRLFYYSYKTNYMGNFYCSLLILFEFKIHKSVKIKSAI